MIEDDRTGLTGTGPAELDVPVREPFTIGAASVAPGKRLETELPVARMITGSPLSIPVLVLHGARPGPTVWLNAAIHGDELNGVEIIRRVLGLLDAKRLAGTVMAVPVVNIPGFMNGDRYLPDRRDLNRSFPGSHRGSLASRIAKLFTEEIVARCEVGIDLHTGSDHRTNLPQVRADLDDPTTADLAAAFGPPVLMHASTRDGSLRQVGADVGVSVLLYEAGEAWRFDEHSIRVGVTGIIRVLAKLDMVPDDIQDHLRRSQTRWEDSGAPIVSRRSRWVRARRTGLAQLQVALGDHVDRGEVLGRIHDTFGHRLSRIMAPTSGVIVGLNLDPVVNQGDAVIHIAEPVAAPTPGLADDSKRAADQDGHAERDQDRDPTEEAADRDASDDGGDGR